MLLRVLEVAEATIEEVLLRVVGAIVCLLKSGKLEGDRKLEICDLLEKT